MRVHTVHIRPTCSWEAKSCLHSLAPLGALGHPGDSVAKSVLPTSAQATTDLCLDWSRSTQQKHVLQQASDVNISNDRAKEEVPEQAGRNGLEGRGREEDTSQTALVCWAPGFQDLTQCLMSLLSQVPDVGGGLEAWRICGQRVKRAGERPTPSHP